MLSLWDGTSLHGGMVSTRVPGLPGSAQLADCACDDAPSELRVDVRTDRAPEVFAQALVEHEREVSGITVQICGKAPGELDPRRLSHDLCIG